MSSVEGCKQAGNRQDAMIDLQERRAVVDGGAWWWRRRSRGCGFLKLVPSHAYRNTKQADAVMIDQQVTAIIVKT